MLMRQIEQLKSLTKIISFGLLVMSCIYFGTRVYSFVNTPEVDYEMDSEANVNGYFIYIDLQYFTIAHSFLCVVISILSFFILKKNA